MNKELELYKLCCTNDNESGKHLVEELGWISNTEFCVWINYCDLESFIKELIRIYGTTGFDNGTLNCNLQKDGVCIDLYKIVPDITTLETTFPKSKYKH